MEEALSPNKRKDITEPNGIAVTAAQRLARETAARLVTGRLRQRLSVLHACFLKKLLPTAAELKVAQLSAYCAEQTQYHHGETSLQSTIINMAQDFVGATNIPLLRPSGQFGTRHHGGKDSASARYIFTELSDAARALFPADDA